MPLVYTKEEIKEYLAGRGFDVTDEAIINQFIHDLKKLVKYEDRQRRRVRLGHEAKDTTLESTGISEDAAVGGNNDHSGRYRSSDFESQAASARRNSRNTSHRGGHHEKETSSGDRHAKHKQQQSNSPLKPSRPHSHHEDRRRLSSSKERERKNSHLTDRDTVDHHRQHGGQRETTHHQNTQHREQVSPKYINTQQQQRQQQHMKDEQRQPLREQNGFDFQPKRNKPTKKGSQTGLVMSRRTLRHENGEQVIEESEVTIGSDGRVTQRPCTASGVSNLDERAAAAASLARAKAAHHDPLSSLLPNSRLQGSDMLRILGRILEESDKEDDSESIATTKILRGPPNRVKRDPVALYHYYKKYWDKLKIPGEDRHMQTRWNVRAQTVGNYPCFEGHPVNYLTRN